MPFTFRLEPILALRQQREETLQIELAVQLREVAAAERRLQALQSRHLEEMENLRLRQAAPHVDLFDVRQGFAYLDALAASIASQCQRVDDLRNQAEDKRGELVRAMQERKAIEKLKDRARSRYQTRLNLAEAAVAEDSTVAQYHRLRRA